MKQVISVRDLEDMLRNGKDVRSVPADALLTPSARDFLRELESSGNHKGRLGQGAQPSSPATPPTAKSSKADLEAFFNSPPIQGLNMPPCGFDSIALCTPTLFSKGFMNPEDMCLVDLEGNQLAGTKKRTSEILMHLQIMKRQPRAVASVHCHPPYSTAFAVAGVEPPTCMIPEFEVFASVATAPDRTPGTPEMGQLVADLTDKHNTILMANHGVVSWSHNNVEDAYFKIEILEAYCRTVLVASQLGKPVKTMTATQLQDLLKIKQNLGIPDPRFGLKECELCDNAEWRPGVTCAVAETASGNSSAAPAPDSDAG